MQFLKKKRCISSSQCIKPSGDAAQIFINKKCQLMCWGETMVSTYM